MRMDEDAKTNEEKIVFYIYLIAKDERPNREKTLKPRPSYRVKTNKLHYVHHRNFGSLDNLPVS